MEMKKIIVTGAQGFLGSRVVDYYASNYMVYGLGHAELDITDKQAVISKFCSLKPDVVIHCAAISDTGYSQQHPEESEQINLYGTVHVAEACKACGAKLVYMSSDQVYNGNAEQGLLPESVEVHPVSVYGMHKLEAERRVEALLADAVGLRLTWMYDLPDSTFKLNRNLLVNLLTTYMNHEQMHVAVREYRGITNVWDVVKRLEACFALPGGVYNFGCENSDTSFEVFMETARMMRLPFPENWIIPDSDRFPDHPRNLSMSIDKIRSLGIDFPSLLEGIKQALSVYAVG